MKIAFNGIGCGWGNNGGTQSVFRMADALAALGHNVQIWSHTKNKFTWFKLSNNVKYLVTDIKTAPSVDAIISSGCQTVYNTYTFSRSKIRIQWLRAHETWTMGEKRLFKLYKLGMPLWVNSLWMKTYLSKIRKDIRVQYCGIPIKAFYHVPVEKNGFTIGALYSDKPRKRFGDVRALMKSIDARFAIYGNGSCKTKEYVQQPNMDRKRKLYSFCDAWISCSENEGLHIPPMEAALCGACIVANSKLSAGNIDYASEDTALMFHNIDDLVAKVELLRKDPELGVELNKKMKKVIVERIGTVEENAKKMGKKLLKML